MVHTILAIGVLGFVTWAHHTFTVGPGAGTWVYFILATIIIVGPPGLEHSGD